MAGPEVEDIEPVEDPQEEEERRQRRLRTAAAEARRGGGGIGVAGPVGRQGDGASVSAPRSTLLGGTA